jgi:hypothetical protein
MNHIVMQMEEMMKELNEKGLGTDELAAAHAEWANKSDDLALKRLKQAVKYGFDKGRTRVGGLGDVRIPSLLAALSCSMSNRRHYLCFPAAQCILPAAQCLCFPAAQCLLPAAQYGFDKGRKRVGGLGDVRIPSLSALLAVLPCSSASLASVSPVN